MQFPDCPGCQTFAEPGEDARALAQEALTGWLEVGLEDGEAPPQPSAKVRVPASGELAYIPVPLPLAFALSVRWARQDAGLTQAQFARRMGVTQQQAAKLESPGVNPTFQTVGKVARALGATVEVTVVRRAPRRVGRAPRSRQPA